MAFLSSIAVKAALIAVGGMAFTLIATLTIIVLYYCTCHRKKNRGSTKRQQERSSTQLQDRPLRPLHTTHSNSTINDSSPFQSRTSTERHRSSIDTGSQWTVVSLATLESGALQGEEMESHLRALPGRLEAPTTNTRRNSELELSQRTWSAYESLPRGVTAFAGPKSKEVTDHERYVSVNSHQPVSEDIDTIDNDAYTTSQEMLSIARSREDLSSHTQQHCILSTQPQRTSTISNTSTGSGYVINSLHSPNELHNPQKDRTSCYSTVSEGYVIDYLEWTTTNRTQPRAILPSIAEDYDNSVQLDYLQIIQ